MLDALPVDQALGVLIGNTSLYAPLPESKNPNNRLPPIRNGTETYLFSNGASNVYALREDRTGRVTLNSRWSGQVNDATLEVLSVLPITRVGMLGRGTIGVDAAERSILGGPANRAAFETYKDSLRAGMEKPFTSDPRLSSILDDLYRPNATVGSGSTAAAVRQELATGASVGGKMHSQKAADSIRALEKWLERNPTARPGDRAAAENVIKDTRNALGW